MIDEMGKIRTIGYGLFVVSILVAVFYIVESEGTRSHAILFVLAYALIIVAIFLATRTERREAQTALEYSEKRFRALIEHSTDVIVLIDIGGKILYTSPSTESVLGYPPKELVNTQGFALVHPDDIYPARRTLAALIQAPENVERLEFRLRHKKGYYIWTETTGTNLLHDPAVGAVVLNYRDITEQRRLDQAKNEFLAITAHQLRNPLSLIRWETERILKHPPKTQAILMKKIQGLHGKILRMITLVNALMYVSRVISGSAPNKPKLIHIEESVKQELSELQPLARQKSVKLIFNPPAKPLPKLFFDPERFSTVISNVVSNAIQYSPKGEVTVTLSQTDGSIDMQIADTGIGIPKEEQTKLFTKFFRASNAKALDTEGTGLGLFVVKSYIDDWYGAIGIESPTLKENRGTTVYIQLPIPTRT